MSKARDLTLSITVKKTPKEVFDAINNVRGWWIGEISGPTDELGGEFTYSYKTFHRTTQKVVELVPNKKVVWRVTKSEINFVKNKKEWNDTEIVFEIIAHKDKTEIRFTHIGLTPAIECYGNCSSGWEFYIKKSLLNWIENGEGIDPGF